MGIHQILRDLLGIGPQRGESEVITELPRAALARALRISPGAPLLILDRVSFEATVQAMERTRRHLLPDACTA